MNDLIIFILFVVISSFIINGWYEVTRYGRLLSFWSSFWEEYSYPNNDETLMPIFKFPEWVRNPTSACIMCMASIYGSIIFWTTYFFQHDKFFFEYTIIEVVLVWIAYLLCLTCSNYIVHIKLLKE